MAEPPRSRPAGSPSDLETGDPAARDPSEAERRATGPAAAGRPPGPVTSPPGRRRVLLAALIGAALLAALLIGFG